MSITYKYLDKRAGTIAAIKDYDSMRFIIRNTDSELSAERDKMLGVGSPDYDGMPHAYNPSAAEDRIVSGIDEIDVLKERYRQAVEYMNWFRPAWEQLTEDERFVLETSYGDVNSYGSGAVSYITSHYGIEQTTAYKRKNRALDRLTVLLFGKE